MSNNNFNLSDDKVNALLNMAAKKLGQDPNALKEQLQAGNLDSVTKNMDQGSVDKLNTMMQNPQAVETLLKSDKLRGLLGGKK